MSLEVDTKKLGVPKQPDPSIRVRFNSLTGERKTHQQLRDDLEGFVDQSVNLSLADLIGAMVKTVAYRDHKLSLDEFIKAFFDFSLAERIVEDFIASLKDTDVDVSNLDELVESEVATRIRQFLERFGLTGSVTLSQFVDSQREDFSGVVSMAGIFVNERYGLRGQLINVINTKIKGLAVKAYTEKFHEDPEGFVMGFMMSRVINCDWENRKTCFDEAQFLKLLSYLDGVGVNDGLIGNSSLYDLLCEERRGMSELVASRRVDVARFNLRDEVKKATNVQWDVDDRLFYGPNFDVQGFYTAFVEPALRKFYAAKQEKVTRVRVPDFLPNLSNPKRPSAVDRTAHLLNFIRRLHDTSKFNPIAFWQKIGAVLGLFCYVGEDNSNLEAIKQHVDFCLQKAEEKYCYVLDEALFYRKDPEIRQAMIYPPEILGCRDLVTLFDWIVSPAAFKERYPKYAAMSDVQIGFAVATFLRDMLRISKKFNDAEFLQAAGNRDLLEDVVVKGELEVVDITKFDINFKLLEELSVNGQSLTKRRFHPIAILQEGLEAFQAQFNPALTVFFNNTDGDVVEHNKVKYRVGSLEEKHFKLVELSVPLMRESSINGGRTVFNNIEKKKIRVLVYTGDEHYIHVKSPMSRLVSEERGKQVTDDVRWTLVFATEEDFEVFKEWVYSFNSTDFIKINDTKEGRDINHKVNGVKQHRSRGSAKFKENQSLVVVKKFNIVIGNAVQDGGQVLVTRGVSLETQCDGLASLLIALSDYSDVSHSKYRAERNWPILFGYYFPPAYWGNLYQDLYKQGPFYVGS